MRMDESVERDFILRKEKKGENTEDGKSIRHYSNYEIINGKVIIPNQECGYWNSFNFEKSWNLSPFATFSMLIVPS